MSAPAPAPVSRGPTVIYLIRHGSTAFNEGSRFRGKSTVPLSDLGRRQAQSVADLLAAKPIAHVACSPLPRAVETANIIAAPHLAKQSPPVPAPADMYHPAAPYVTIDDGYTSANYGPWEGHTTEEIAISDPQGYKMFREHIDQAQFDGETLDGLSQRFRASLLRLVEQFPGQQVAVITHQICTRAVLCDLMGAPKSFYWQLGQEPGCVNVIEYHDGKFSVKIMNWTPDMWDKVGVVSKAW
ncbi:putative histidine phosphatase family protein [Paratrimastix pyriformis]|uniref:Histidine phosphatase family protein n=1 Tax=Paratrimastix pyriformis TaxID=342808 RepID=A0ABQ8UPT9_9EUKA|nr:putative histidine phosphatase family protein [Paratrimastix pyriformis]